MKWRKRSDLLSIKGVGPETADVILMYGIQKGEFVVDTYARRLFACLDYQLPPSYQKAKDLVEANVDHFTLRNYQNFHAMIVMFNQKYTGCQKILRILSCMATN